jgi:type I restriction enzyme S subunit
VAELDEWGVLKVGCVNGISFDADENKALPAGVEPRPELEIKAGDILMSRANTRELLGSASVVRTVRPRLLLCDKLYRLKVLHTVVDEDYLVLSLGSNVARFQMEREATGASSSMQNISQETVRNLIIPLPPISEQRAIISFLNRETVRIDALVAKKERLIELLQEKRTALINQAVTKGLDPSASMKDSGMEWLGEIPAHWQVKRLKFLAQVRTGITKGRTPPVTAAIELPYLRVANVQNGYLDLEDISTITVGVDEVPSYALKAGDVLMNEGGDYDKVGRGTVWGGQIDPCLHQNHVFAVRPNGHVEPQWLATITLTSYAKHYFIINSKQSTNLASISSTNLAELPVVVPPAIDRSAILMHIHQETGKLDALIAKVREHIEKLREYRAALISAAATGKIDVREEIA